jgi:hypothetical protein
VCKVHFHPFAVIISPFHAMGRQLGSKLTKKMRSLGAQANTVGFFYVRIIVRVDATGGKILTEVELKITMYLTISKSAIYQTFK